MPGGDGFEIFAAEQPGVDGEEQQQRPDAGDEQQQVKRQEQRVPEQHAQAGAEALPDFAADAERGAERIGVIFDLHRGDDLIKPERGDAGGDGGEAEPEQQQRQDDRRRAAAAAGPEDLQPLGPAGGFDARHHGKDAPAGEGKEQQRQDDGAQQHGEKSAIAQLGKAEDKRGRHAPTLAAGHAGNDMWQHWGDDALRRSG